MHDDDLKLGLLGIMELMGIFWVIRFIRLIRCIKVIGFIRLTIMPSSTSLYLFFSVPILVKIRLIWDNRLFGFIMVISCTFFYQNQGYSGDYASEMRQVGIIRVISVLLCTNSSTIWVIRVIRRIGFIRVISCMCSCRHQFW